MEVAVPPCRPSARQGRSRGIIVANHTDERWFERKRMRLSEASYADPSSVYFATLCTRDKQQVFLHEGLARQIVDALMWCREKERFRIYAYCLMPDHLHMAISPSDSRVHLSQAIGRFKSHTTRASWKLGFEGPLWQRSWYDHIARRDEDIGVLCAYILENPLRKGLISEHDGWPYSGMPDPLR